jgi:CRISPR-associated endonuclease/helicase Cas3
VIHIDVDLTNPGQFLGCCGVFELAQRLWPRAVAHFEATHFVVSEGDLNELVERASQARLDVLELSNQTSSALWLDEPFDLRLDWWKFERGLKTWAGRMSVDRIATSLQRDLPNTRSKRFFDDGHVVLGPDGKKVEPFYFDGRRGATALPLDVGFSTDALALETVAFSATEFFTLVGLQRFRPREAKLRVYRYRAWRVPLPATLAALAAANTIPDKGPLFQFESAFRTDQRKHKAFSPAVPVHGDGNE